MRLPVCLFSLDFNTIPIMSEIMSTPEAGIVCQNDGASGATTTMDATYRVGLTITPVLEGSESLLKGVMIYPANKPQRIWRSY